MNEWQRAVDFMRMADIAASEKIVPFPRGRALVNRRLALVHDANYLLADKVNDVTASELINEAEQIQGQIGLGHRRVNVDDQTAAVRLTPGFQDAGFRPEAFVIMVHRGPAPAAKGPARKVSWEPLREARRIRRLREPWASPELIDQILARQLLIAGSIETAYYGVVIDALVVASCELRRHGTAAQIETVETLEAYRGCGYARSVLSAALEAASDAEFVFLVTDHDDWPQHFYGRLGFEPVGLETRFLRLLDVKQ